MSINATLIAFLVTPFWTVDPPSETTLRSLHSECFAFDAVIDAVIDAVKGPLEGEAPDGADGALLSGASDGPRWYLESDERFANGGSLSSVCDGSRIWVRTSGVVFLEPIGKQFSVPFPALWLAPLLQIGEDLTSKWMSDKGRWRQFGNEPTLTESAPNECTLTYAWGGDPYPFNEYRYTFRRVGEAWFWSGIKSAEFHLAADGSRITHFHSVMSMEEPIAVGSGLCATRIRSEGWVRAGRDRRGELKLARTTAGRLLHAALLDRADFDREILRRMTLQEGTTVLDRTPSAVLRFVVGSRVVDFDGVSYELASPVMTPPTDRELIEHLRSAKRLASSDSAVLNSSARGAELAQGVHASASVTSNGVRIEPGRSLDLGAVQFGDTPKQVDASFQLTNVGVQARAIKSVKASCGGTQTKADRLSIEPGATATISTMLTVERSKTYHSSIWIAFEDGQVEELHIVAVGVPEKAVRATAVKQDPAGDVLTIVLHSNEGKPSGDIGIPSGAEAMLASDTGWLPVGGDADNAKHWIRDIVKRP